MLYWLWVSAMLAASHPTAQPNSAREDVAPRTKSVDAVALASGEAPRVIVRKAA